MNGVSSIAVCNRAMRSGGDANWIFDMVQPKMVAMSRRPIGVWFSVALVILLVSLWLGSMLGSKIAGYWYGHYRLAQGTLSRSELSRVESELTDLDAAQTLRVLTLLTYSKKEFGDKYLLQEIAGLEEIKRRSSVSEVKSAIDLDLGLAHIDAATTEEQNNNTDLAKKNINAAQVVFESLGWKDYSEEALKIAAGRGHLRLKPGESER